MPTVWDSEESMTVEHVTDFDDTVSDANSSTGYPDMCASEPRSGIRFVEHFLDAQVEGGGDAKGEW